MAGSKRYIYRRLLSNRSARYAEQLKARKVRVINHYDTPNLNYPDSDQLARVTIMEHVWGHGDRYYKLAHKYYGEKKLWWVIASFNQAPTESHLKTGQIVQIPMPVEVAISVLRG